MKKILAVLLAVALLFCLVGCMSYFNYELPGSTGSAQPQTSASPAATEQAASPAPASAVPTAS